MHLKCSNISFIYAKFNTIIFSQSSSVPCTITKSASLTFKAWSNILLSLALENVAPDTAKLFKLAFNFPLKLSKVLLACKPLATESPIQ